MNPSNRRSFLSMLGASAALAPLIPLTAREVQAGGAPLRIVFVTTCNGTILEDWRPVGGESDFELSPILEPLAPFKDDLLIVDGVDNLAYYTGPSVAGHFAMGTLWSGAELLDGDDFVDDTGKPSGWGGGVTVDQTIASAIGNDTPLRSLELGVQVNWNDVRARPHYLQPGQPMVPREDPMAVFNQLFADSLLSADELARLLRRRGSVLDLAHAQLQAVRPKLAAVDQQRMDAHLQAVRALEDRLKNVPGQCVPPAAPPPNEPQANDDFPLVGALQTDLLVQALACDITRVATLQWGKEREGPAFTWLGSQANHHAVSHETVVGDKALMSAINRWFATQFAALLERLRATVDADGVPLMDNTIVVWSSPLGTGRNHSARNVPVVIAQGANGPFRTGRYLRFGNHDPYANVHADHGGVAMNQLLVSLCHAMGLDNVETFGTPTLGTSGPLPNLI